MKNSTIYLGDGAYVEFTGYSFRLYTEGDFGVHEAHLEPEGLLKLIEFAKEKGLKL